MSVNPDIIKIGEPEDSNVPYTSNSHSWDDAEFQERTRKLVEQEDARERLSAARWGAKDDYGNFTKGAAEIFDAALDNYMNHCS